MKKKVGNLKKGDKIKIAGEVCLIEEIEHSDIGKQGTKKTRMVLRKGNGDSFIVIRPEDYPIEIV